MTLNLDEIKSRINPQYANALGTESYERRMLVEEIERLRRENQSLKDIGSPVTEGTIQHQAMEIARLKQVCRNAYEVYAGSEGIPEPRFASEAYVLSLLMAMVEEVKEGLGHNAGIER